MIGIPTCNLKGVGTRKNRRYHLAFLLCEGHHMGAFFFYLYSTFFYIPCFCKIIVIMFTKKKSAILSFLIRLTQKIWCLPQIEVTS